MDTFEATMIAEGADGYATEDEEVYREAWQYLIDTGICWRLQGWFGRTACDLIGNGFCKEPS
jgi:hypothetical protein